MIVYDRNGNLLSKGDNVTYGTTIWSIDKIVAGGLKLSRFGVKRTVDPDKVVKSR